MSRYNKLYRDIAVMECRLSRGGLCRDTTSCIMTDGGSLAGGECVTIQSFVS